MKTRFLLATAAFALCMSALPALAQTDPDIVVVNPPPEPREETVPPEGPTGEVWSKGYWMWKDNNYVWVTGHWIENHPGQTWVSEHWEKRDGQWHFVSGHWE